MACVIAPVSVATLIWHYLIESEIINGLRTNHIKSFLCAYSCLFSRGTEYSANEFELKFEEIYVANEKKKKLTTSYVLHEPLSKSFVSLSQLRDAGQGMGLDNQVTSIDRKDQ